LGNNGALTVLSPIDGRVIHMVPWNELSYIGATDTSFDGPPDECYATADDVVYLLRSANALFPHARLAPTDVVATRAGLRTLMATEGGLDSSIAPREHSLVEHESGLISVVGGRVSTHRLIAVEAVDCVARALHRLDGRPVAQHAGTTHEPLPGGEVRALEVLEEEVARDGFPREVAAHLVRAFGSETPAVTRLAMAEPDLAAPVVPGHPIIAAELVHAMRREMAITLADLAIRRTHLFYDAPNHAIEQISAVASLAAREMAWDAERRAAELAAYQSEINLNMSFRHELGPPPT
jgi:glycerol-3-phosphate dehydrogenase